MAVSNEIVRSFCAIVQRVDDRVPPVDRQPGFDVRDAQFHRRDTPLQLRMKQRGWSTIGGIIFHDAL